MMRRRPPAELFLGIDVGGTVAKVGLFSADGTRIRVSSARVQVLQPAPGRSERDLDDLWAQVATLIQQTVHDPLVEPTAIAGVGVTGYGNGLLLLDALGRPTCNAISSTDSRARAIVSAWHHRGSDELLRSRTWHEPWPGQPLALLQWLSANSPDVLERSATLLTVKDYVRYRLTHEIAVELTDLSSAGLINGSTRASDEQLFAAVDGAPWRALLPRSCLMPQEIAGAITAECAAATGLREGIPVAAGLSDGLAMLLGSGITSDESISVVSGTWGLNQRLWPQPVLPPQVFGTDFTFTDDRYLVVDNSTAGATNLDWFVKSFTEQQGSGGELVYSECEEMLASTDPRESQVLFLPFVHGSLDDPLAAAAFKGLGSLHTKAHALRAVCEGVALEHRFRLNRLIGATGAAYSARLGGGVVASPAWTQVFANVLALPIEIPLETQLGTLGAALTAAVATGYFATFDEASVEMTAIAKTLRPEPELVEVYGERYVAYLDLRAQMGSGPASRESSSQAEESLR
jgi:L-xylulokinase